MGDLGKLFSQLGQMFSGAGSAMAGGPGAATLPRDTIYSAVMIICTGVVGLCLLVGGLMTYPVAGAGGAQVVEFVRVHNTVRLLARNLDVTAKPGTPEARAVEASYSASLLGSTPVARILTSSLPSELPAWAGVASMVAAASAAAIVSFFISSLIIAPQRLPLAAQGYCGVGAAFAPMLQVQTLIPRNLWRNSVNFRFALAI